MKKSKLLLSLVLVWALFAGILADALSVPFKATVYSSSMPVYSKKSASDSYKTATLKKGASFTVTSYTDDWAQISYSGKTGYAKVSDMKFSEKTPMYTQGSCKMYASASSSSKVLASFSVNALVNMIGQSGSYYLVNDGDGHTGYIKKTSLGKSFVKQTLYAKELTYVYEKASSSSDIVSCVATGAKITAAGESGNYYKVSLSSPSVSGYVSKSHFTAEKQKYTPKTAYINANDTPLYVSAKTGSQKIGAYDLNTKVYLFGEIGSYTAVAKSETGVAVGFVRTKYLNAAKTTATPKVTATPKTTATPKPTATSSSSKRYATKIAYVYEKASSSAAILTCLATGTDVTVTGESNDFYKIKFGSYTGYARKNALSASSVTVSRIAAYVNRDDCPMYLKASTGSKKIDTLKKNDTVYIVQEYGDFYAVSTSKTSDTVGFIAKSRLSSSKTTATPKATATPKVTATPKPTATSASSKRYATKIAYVYEKASSSAAVLTCLATGTDVTVTGESSGFYKIKFGSYTGYARKNALSANSVSVTRTAAYVNCDDCPMYLKASTGSRKIDTLSLNETVYIVQEYGSYYAVSASKTSDTVGFIAKSRLSSAKTTPTPKITATPKPTATPSPSETSIVPKQYAVQIAYVYEKASESAAVITCLATGAGVTVTGGSGAFFKIQFGSYTGYARKNALSVKKPSVSWSVAYANCNDCPVYLKASSSSKKIDTLKKNDTVYIVQEYGDYYAVSSSTNASTVGFIPQSNLSGVKVTTTPKSTATPKPTSSTSPTETPIPRGTYHSDTSSTEMPPEVASTQSTYSPSLSDAEKIEYIIYYMQSRLGYYYSSKPDNKATFDCVTLCYYAFKSAGKYIPSSSYDCGYSGSFPYIDSISDLKRGDLVCFDTIEEDKDKSDHVGVYLGNNYFIHCSSGAGMIIVSTLKSGYYKTHFYCGRRIF